MREGGFDRNEILAERQERSLRRLFVDYDPESFFIGEHYGTKRPPTPEEFTMGMKVEVNRLRLELLLSPPPPQHDLLRRQSNTRPPPILPPCSSPPPCAEPESSGGDKITSDSLEALANGQEEERWEVPLVVWPNDMVVGIHRERRKILLLRVQVLGEEGKVAIKRENPALESTLAGIGLETPRELHLEMRQTAVDGF